MPKSHLRYYSPMPILRNLLTLTAFSLCAFSTQAQQNDASSRLLNARPLYYTPTTAGLKSFQCNVSFDWKSFLNAFAKTPIADDNPVLIYLKTTKLSVSDDLDGKGQLLWTDTTKPPEAFVEGGAKMEGGMQQMFDAYFQTWNAYMNGSMVPAPDKTVAVTPDGDGVQLSGLTPGETLVEKFDKNMLLTETHVANATIDELDHPVFTPTPDGLVISTIHSLSHQPPTAPPAKLDLSTTYAKVGKFQLPASITFTVENVGTFLFNLSGCQVNPAK
jgi:hypothetical protein